MHLQRVTLEVSLKPFHTLDEGFFRAVARRMFQQWNPLIQQADVAQVMLWAADGSEILEYQGDLDAPFEWARYIGGANPRHAVPNDPEGKALHSRWYLYRDDPPVWTYRWLRTLNRVLKEVGREVTGKPTLVGETFDPGPEFAISPFKYERHNEICLAGTMGPTSFVCCYGVLHGDHHPYAGFPDGIPEGTPLGTFLGRQSAHFLRDCEFDYLWLSNGFGFGQETWGTTGPLFDGERFDATGAAACREKILDFWRRFRAECPDVPLEVRGTNLSVGIDLASEAVPWDEINRGGFGQAAPPNSPWAALDGDFGLELMGYLSRIAELPGEGFPFRYYTHDPWWLNSPWLDRYGREPHDIYLPLSVSRITPDGAVQTAEAVNLLSVDDSYGELPDQVPNEVNPHLLKGLADGPDAPGPLVWLYPFADYHADVFGPEPRLELPFYGDWFIRAAINNGLPLNTVVSSRYFADTLAKRPGLYDESVLLAPVPEAAAPWAEPLREWVEAGGKALLYGPTRHAHEAWRQRLNVRLDAPLTDELALDLVDCPDVLAQPYPTRTMHRELTCAGGVEEVLADPAVPGEVLATVARDGATRLAAIHRALPEWQGGAVAWVRGTNSNRVGPRMRLLAPDDPAQWFPGDLLLRYALARLGWRFLVRKREPAQRSPLVCVARNAGAYQLSGYQPNTTVGLRLRFPAGAPLLLGYETWLDDGHATYTMPRAWHRECRVLVDGQTSGELSCVEVHSGEMGIRRRMQVRGLQNATLRFFPEPGTEDQVTVLCDPKYPYLLGDFRMPRSVTGRDGCYLEVSDVSGTVLVSW